MQYVCRSCLLRLGHPWRIPARQRQLGHILPQTTRRANQTLGASVDRGSPEHYDGHVHSNFDPASTTNSRHPTDGLVNSAGDRASTKPNAPAPLPKFLRKIAHSFRKAKVDPEWLAHDRTSHRLEDMRAVAIDEALDSEAQEAQEDYGYASGKHGAMSIGGSYGSPQLGAGSTQQAEANSEHELIYPALSRRDTNQFSYLRANTKKCYLTSAIEEFNSWKSSFAALSDPRGAEPSPMELKMLSWLLIHESVEPMRAVLQSSLPDKMRRERDRLLLHVALRFVPERAPMVLEALFADTIPPFYMVEDSLQFLATLLRKSKNPDEKEALAGTLANLVVHICDHSSKQYIRFSQNTLCSILQALPAEEVAGWFNKLVEVEHLLHGYTMLHFASRFAKVPATKALSLDILRDLCGRDTLNINTPIGASLCTSILTFEEDNLVELDDDLATPAELFQCLLDFGLVPNVITYTAIIRDLCLKKELATALNVLDVMKQHGVKPDAYTYSVIINGCKSVGDFDALIHFAMEARESNAQDPHVWNDIIHATFLACLKEPRIKGGLRRPRFMVWGPMNAIYSRFFHPQHLRSLMAPQLTEVRKWMEIQGYIPTKIQGAFVGLPALTPDELWQPRSSTLGLMIMGLVRHLSTPYDVILFYSHFRELLKQGHPIAELLVREQGSLVHDIVIRALLKWRGTLRVMLDIIRDMMRDVDPITAGPISSPSTTPTPQPTEEVIKSLNAEASKPDVAMLVADTEAPSNDPEGEVPDTETAQPEPSMTDAEADFADAEPQHAASPTRHPRPSVHTWSILLKAFMYNRLPGQAEQVLKLMQHHKIKPNIVTWNTLAASYAKLGKTQQAVEAMRRLEAAGFKSDDWTLRAFSYIPDKGRAIRLMERTVEKNRITKMAMDHAQAEDEEKRRREQQQLIEDEMRERDDQQERSPQGGPQQPQEEPDVVADNVSREVYEEVVKIVGEAVEIEKPALGAWETTLWDEAAGVQPPSEHGDSRESRGSNA